MKYANTIANVLYQPTDCKYDQKVRQWQGCPTIAITPGGRIYAGWYTGGSREPHINNYNMLVYSDDKGKSWSEPLLIIPGNEELQIQALDIQLWTAPDGRLFVFWVQNNVEKACGDMLGFFSDGCLFTDNVHAQWMVVCDNPDSDTPTFSQPRCIDKGFLRCKPLCTKSGRWILFNYSQDANRYGYSISDDYGETFTHMEGAEKIATPFDETMAYQLDDGSIRMMARSYIGELAESTSTDNGETWSKAIPTGIESPNTRFFVAKTLNGNVLLV
ncbi:MAG: exo-alpha-sialidase, partial [Clostridia bacterium]|nr:exo-alpha-sialidase [Clostridia bacterium]